MYDKKAGYKGKQQGEINDKNPAPNAKNKFKSPTFPTSLFLFFLFFFVTIL
ncbi:hypothetical protein EMIT0180MI3_30015 [Priestia megaterium]